MGSHLKPPCVYAKPIRFKVGDEVVYYPGQASKRIPDISKPRRGKFLWAHPSGKARVRYFDYELAQNIHCHITRLKTIEESEEIERMKAQMRLEKTNLELEMERIENVNNALLPRGKYESGNHSYSYGQQSG